MVPDFVRLGFTAATPLPNQGFPARFLAKVTGRKRADSRRMLEGIVFRMRSGCQWNRLPRELGDDSTIAEPDIWKVPAALYHRLVDSLAYAA